MSGTSRVEKIELLDATMDAYGGVTVDLKEAMDSEAFAYMLRASMAQWMHKGKKGIWIKPPIELVNLVEPVVKEGFRYHHAETSYLMLVKWISEIANTLPANASQRVGTGAFVMNHMGEVLVVQEKNGKFKGTEVWKLPTGVVDEGEDICTGAIREVKEEAGAKPQIILWQVVCMLRPLSFYIQQQD